MKKLFKTSLLIAALLVGVCLNAQEKATTLGVKAGLNLSNLGGDAEGAKAKVGFNVGLTLDQAISQDVYLLTGLEYSLKGAKAGEGISLNLGYLQLPVHIGYKLAVNENTKIVFRAGPYLGYAVNGTWKIGGVSVDAFGDEAKEADVDLLKRFDFGLGGGVGAEFGKIGVTLGYDLGLANILDTDQDVSLKNQNAYLSLGYKF